MSLSEQEKNAAWDAYAECASQKGVRLPDACYAACDVVKGMQGNAELRKAAQAALDQINPCERMRGTENYACRWCLAFGPHPKQIHHAADCGWSNLKAALAPQEPRKESEL